MAAGPDKVYHEGQRGLGKALAFTPLLTRGSWDSHFLAGTDEVACQAKAAASSPRWRFSRLKRAGISKRQGRGQEIEGLKAHKINAWGLYRYHMLHIFSPSSLS